ncbi:MAG: hypothetical protein WCH58_00150 [Candidatus Saccharibacteria bacterium]
MINLLPEDTKKQLRAAHYNVILLKYITFLGAGMAFLVLACGVSYFYLLASSNSGSDKGTYAAAKKQLDSLKSSISITNNIFAERVSYSSVITAIAAALPAGTAINQLSIDSSISGTSATFQINGSSTVTAESLKTNFASSVSPLFANFSVQPTEQSSSGGSASDAPINCVLTINKGVFL